MGPNDSRGRTLFLGYSGVVLLVAACGCTQQPQPHVAAPPLKEPVGATNMQAPDALPNTGTAATVSISTEVLRACNIPDVDSYFAFNSGQPTSSGHAPLDQLASCFEHGPMVGHKLELVGHADACAAPDYSDTLGQERAKAVADYLVGRGLERSRILTSSLGALDSNGRTRTGWAHDRRVDVFLDQ